ncbi:MAG: ARMT1-like domain-containing protein [Candidatus Omnitrophota bacterium]
MKTQRECIPCFFRQIEHTSDLVGLSAKQRYKLFMRLSDEVLAFDFNNPPIVFGKIIYNAVSRACGRRDIFAAEKVAVERYLTGATKVIEDFLVASGDPLYQAAKLSCAANAIDFGAGRRPDIPGLMRTLTHLRLRVDHYNYFLKKLKSARVVLFVADNCGEAVFDKFFISQIRRANPAIEVFFAVRSGPIINDVVLSDARRIGLETVATVLSSGCDYPGLILSKTSVRFRRIYGRADIIVSKGQGNFESFAGTKDIFYLFKVKCPAVSKVLGLTLGSLLFLYNKESHVG